MQLSWLNTQKLVGAQTDNLSFGKEGIGVYTWGRERVLSKEFNSDLKSVMYFAWKNDDIVGCANISGMKRRMSHRANFAISVLIGMGKRNWKCTFRKCISFAKDNEIEIINLEYKEW